MSYHVFTLSRVQIKVNKTPLLLHFYYISYKEFRQVVIEIDANERNTLDPACNEFSYNEQISLHRLSIC